MDLKIESSDVLWKCQNCHLPLQIDSSLVDLSGAQRDAVVNAAPKAADSSYTIPKERLERARKITTASELKLQNSALVESYVFLKDAKQVKTEAGKSTNLSQQDSQEYARTKTLSTQVAALSNMFNVLSSKSSIDYPVCEDCCNLLIQRLKSQYDEALQERDMYEQFLQKLKQQKSLDEHSTKTTTSNEVQLLQEESGHLLQQLRKLETEEDELDKEIMQLHEDMLVNKREREEMLRQNNSHDLEQFNFSKEIQSLTNQYEYGLTTLDNLRAMNIYNETFKISHEGAFGTINGLRIGGFDKMEVPWQEINAALGQVILLLVTICTTLHIQLENYKLKPMGSTSKVLKLDSIAQEWVSFDAYHTDNFKVSKIFRRETDMDKSLECLLEILKQVVSKLLSPRASSFMGGADGAEEEEEEEEAHVDIALPYAMHKDKINGLSVKLLGNKPNLEWTTAMKFFLTNLKWLLVYSSSRLFKSTKK